MNVEDRNWDSLTALWRSPADAIDPPLVRRLIASHRRRLVLGVIGETALLASFAWLSWLVARDGVAAWEAVWLATLWVFSVIAVAFAWWNRRGAWKAIGLSVADFRRQRARRHARSLRFGILLFVAEVVAAVAQLAWFDRFTPPVVLVLAVLAAALGAWCVWLKRRIAADLASAGEET